MLLTATGGRPVCYWLSLLLFVARTYKSNIDASSFFAAVVHACTEVGEGVVKPLCKLLWAVDGTTVSTYSRWWHQRE